MPAWASILEAASEWGTPPWEIVKAGNSLWLMRWLTYRSEISKAQETKRDHS